MVAVRTFFNTCCLASVLASTTSPTPIQKVLQLLDGMQAKGKQAKHEEETQFAEFQQFCDSTRQATTNSIDQAKSQIEQFQADIAKAEADAEQFGNEVAKLEAAVAKAQGELKQVRAVREKEHADFLATEADLGESVDAIQRALVVLRSREKDVPQSLLQVAELPGLPQGARATIQSFAALDAAPAPNAYEFQSGGVVSLLENLRRKFKDQKLALQKAEMSAKSNFELLAQSLEDNVEEDSRRSKAKSEARGQRLKAAAVTKGDLTTTQATKAEDEKALEDTLAACHARSVEFEKNQVVRAEEIKAIQQAIDILSSEDVTGNADKYLPKFLQTSVRRGTALFQLRASGTPEAVRVRERLATFLSGRAEKLGSHYLSFVATHSRADPFPFNDVSFLAAKGGRRAPVGGSRRRMTRLLQDLIVKLMEQANSEADHKAYCDAELAKNKATRENKQSEVEELSAGVDGRTAQSAQLAEELTRLADEIAELRREQTEATTLRHEEKAANTQTISDAKAAQVAVERAMQVLRDFYAKVAGDASLLQEPYKGLQSEHGGVVGFLEVIMSDFARLESETSNEEDLATAAYEKFMDETNEDIAVKETAVNHKTAKKRDVDTENSSLKKELELTQKELDAANAYYDSLRPECIDHGLSYVDRVRMREEEIQSLKEALEILNQQDVV